MELCGASQYCKDKKNSRGPKVISLNGSTFCGTTVDSLINQTGKGIKKGYYH